MRNLKKLTALAAVSALALGASTAANAAVFVAGGTAGGSIIGVSAPVVNVDAGVEFINDDLNLTGPFVLGNNTETVVVGDGVGSIVLDFNVDQAEPNGPAARGIVDFAVMVEGDMGASFMLSGITDADGFLVVPANSNFAVTAGETLTFIFSGTAFATQLAINSGLTPGYSVGAFGVSEVPVPAAGLLFGTAALGGALARRKRKAS